jgi:dTMP kinase
VTHAFSHLAGRFLVFEGPDGSGKSTQLRRLRDSCRAGGLTVCDVRDPGGTPIGERIRQMLLSHASAEMTPVCETMLYMASRAQLVSQVIRPAIARGNLVLADRFVPSTLAYQGAAGGVTEADIRAAAQVATGGLKPDLVVVFDVDEDTAAHRLSPLLDRMEAKGREFHRRVRAGYLAQAKADREGYLVIDASGDVDAVWESLLTGLRARLAER